MSRKEMIDSAVEHLRTRAGVRAVYGEPVVIKGKTIIPVAKVTLGAGSGARGGNGTAEYEPHDEGEHEPTPEMSNGTGTVDARPVGVVEISDKETKFVGFGQMKKFALAAAIGSGLGVILGWMLGRRKGGGA